MVRRSARAFFNLRPPVLLPVPDRPFVAFQRSPDRTLATPVKFAQNPPDVVFVVSHSGALLDELAHSSGGPRPAGETKRFRPALERAFEVAQLGGTEFRRAPGTLGLAQSAHAGLFQVPRPSADRLAMHADFARDLGLAESCSEQSRRLHAPLFQRSEVPSHSCWITHALYISKNQNPCHYLMQDSIGWN
jgi:hypothetical protein